jgi:ABC-type multidrug transport system fused ATPase/permease subunit
LSWSAWRAGNARDCQTAIEEVGESLLELEESDVPANYVVRLRAEQAALRKSLLRVYHIQREQFLPSAKAMITTIVVVILAMLLITDMGGLAESLISLGFLSFFFLYLLRLLNVIDTPFKVGQERTEDDVSLFLLTEFMVHAQAADGDNVRPEDVEAHAAAIEEQLIEVEAEQAAELEAAEKDAAASEEQESRTPQGSMTRPEA